MSELVATAEQPIARPLSVLVRLIHADLQHGREAAERAGLPHYQAAGEKLLEAKAILDHGEFEAWVKRNFGIAKQTAHNYMRLASATLGQKSIAMDFSSLGDFLRQNGQPSYNRPPSAWHAPVREIIERVDTETLNLKRDEMKRAEERDAQRKLALQLIDIGFKVLARELHPDKGGSKVAMARLNAVRDRLKAAV